MIGKLTVNPGRIFANFLILAVLYGNTSVFLTSCFRNPPFAGQRTGAFPGASWMNKLFNNFKVFDGYSPINTGFSARGLTTRTENVPKAPTADMIDLQIYEYFPMWYGEATVRIGLNQLEPSKRPASHSRMATKIRELYNEKHPDKKVEQVVIYYHEWPESRDGYFHRLPEGGAMLVGHD